MSLSLRAASSSTLPSGHTETSAARSGAWALVSLLMLAHVMSFVDRTVLNLLVEPVKRDLGVSDVQMSLLIGPTFGLFYAVMGFPIGRLSDQFPRLRIVVIGIALWTLCTMAGGLANSYTHLFLARVGVAVGEAVLHPVAHSVISDTFPPERRGRAMGIYVLGAYLGSALALVFGGAIAGWAQHVSFDLLGSQVHGWKLVLILVSTPGLLIALILAFWREPPRRVQHRQARSRRSVLDVLRVLVREGPAYGSGVVAVSMMALVGYSMAAWAPTHLVRAFGWSIGRAGFVLGSIGLPFSVLGLLGAGWIADRLARRMRDGKFFLIAILALAGVPAMIALGLSSSASGFLAAYIIASICSGGAMAIGPASVQEIVPGDIRGQASGLYSLSVAILGLGIGPPAVALVQKYVLPAQSLAAAMGVVGVCAFVIAALLCWNARPAFRRTIARREEELAGAL